MKTTWGVVGCAYMSIEYCKVLLAKGVAPKVYTRDLASPNVAAFHEIFPSLDVEDFTRISEVARNWLVCTNIASHDEVCGRLQGTIYCEKPFAATSAYDADKDIAMLMNRRYYYWVDYINEIIDRGKIVKIIASIPEQSVGDVMARSIHVIDLLWYLTGTFGKAMKVGTVSPTYVLDTAKGVPLVINMNYGAHENFSVRFYADDGVVYEARPLEWFSITNAMEVREPDDDLPIRTYRPVSQPLAHVFTNFKPGLEELMDDLLQNKPNKLASLSEHRHLQTWMEDNLL